MDYILEWGEYEGDKFSFEDSDRFEEDSLCSWVSEPESVCNNWRGWKRQNGSPSQGANKGELKHKDSGEYLFYFRLGNITRLLFDLIISIFFKAIKAFLLITKKPLMMRLCYKNENDGLASASIPIIDSFLYIYSG